MPAQALAIVLRAGEIAAKHGWEVYLVGGYVRDCLLKIPDYDIDTSVVGDAPEMARILAAETSAGWKTTRVSAQRLCFLMQGSSILTL